MVTHIMKHPVLNNHFLFNDLIGCIADVNESLSFSRPMFSSGSDF